MALRAAGSLAGPPVVETERPGPHVVPTPATEADDQEDVLLVRLPQLMQVEKVYRQEGFGLNALVAALDTGFQSIGSFNRAFKAHTGMTPTAYRKQAES